MARGHLPTLTGGQRAAPLAIAPALGPGGPLEQVACVTCEVHEVVQVELAAIGDSMGRVSRVSTGDGCGEEGPRSLSTFSMSAQIGKGTDSRIFQSDTSCQKGNLGKRTRG
jgi:hypothetical protein